MQSCLEKNIRFDCNVGAKYHKSVKYDCPGECSPEKTVCGDNDRCFDHLSGSHHQSQVNFKLSVDVTSLWLLS